MKWLFNSEFDSTLTRQLIRKHMFTFKTLFFEEHMKVTSNNNITDHPPPK